jgi:hypothetical protein
VTVRIAIPGKAIGKNQTHMPAPRTSTGPRILLTPIARAYMDVVRRIGRTALAASDWPKDPLVPKRVRMTVRMFGSRHDALATTHLIRDALQRVFYADDKIVCHGPEEAGDPKAYPARVEVDLELLETRTPAEVERLRRDDTRSVPLLVVNERRRR